MLDTLLLILFNSLLIFGLHYSMDYEKDAFGNISGEIFFKFRLFIEKNISLLAKPLCSCVICMSSIHSFYVFWLFNDFGVTNIFTYVLYVPALAGFNFILNELIEN